MRSARPTTGGSSRARRATTRRNAANRFWRRSARGSRTPPRSHPSRRVRRTNPYHSRKRARAERSLRAGVSERKRTRRMSARPLESLPKLRRARAPLSSAAIPSAARTHPRLRYQGNARRSSPRGDSRSVLGVGNAIGRGSRSTAAARRIATEYAPPRVRLKILRPRVAPRRREVRPGASPASPPAASPGAGQRVRG